MRSDHPAASQASASQPTSFIASYLITGDRLLIQPP